MFEKRKSIIIGETYIFDPLNESNLANGTSAVTVIKKAKKNSWIVMSVNNKDVFECPENLLIEIKDYYQIQPIIRCQYGATDFDNTDVAFFDILEEYLASMREVIEDDAHLKLNNMISDYAKELKEKIYKYAQISMYKYKIGVITNLKNAIIESAKNVSINSDDDKPIDLNNIKLAKSNVSSDVVDNFTEKLNESGFYDDFDEAVQNYMRGEINREDFIGIALDLLEDEFPKEAMIPEKQYRCITPSDIDSLKRASAKALHSNHMVFLVGRTSKGNQIAVCVFDMCDFNEIDKFVYTCYDKWEDKTVNYYSDYRIVLLSVPNRPAFLDNLFGDGGENSDE